MNINVVDCKKNKVINVKIELSEQTFIVTPEIVDPKFNYMRQRLMDIRKRYMNLYLENTQNYMVYENQLYNEMKDMLIKEMENIYRTEGVMYYTR